MAGHAAAWMGDGVVIPAARIASTSAAGNALASSVIKGCGHPSERLTPCLVRHAAISVALGGGAVETNGRSAGALGAAAVVDDVVDNDAQPPPPLPLDEEAVHEQSPPPLLVAVTAATVLGADATTVLGAAATSVLGADATTAAALTLASLAPAAVDEPSASHRCRLLAGASDFVSCTSLSASAAAASLGASAAATSLGASAGTTAAHAALSGGSHCTAPETW